MKLVSKEPPRYVIEFSFWERETDHKIFVQGHDEGTPIWQSIGIKRERVAFPKDFVFISYEMIGWCKKRMMNGE